MYAIIADGGRQYKVEEGQELEVDFREVEDGAKLDFDSVLAVSNDSGVQIGKPMVVTCVSSLVVPMGFLTNVGNARISRGLFLN